MNPPVRLGDPAPFHEFDEYVFQDLCCDVFGREPTVASCEVYGRRGQIQRGIDIHAIRRAGDGVEVAQCKRYQRFTSSDVRAASKSFLDHWQFWNDKQVRRFVLIVSCSLQDTDVQDQIGQESRTFSELGIAYEAWSPATLTNKLRPHRDIVRARFAIPDVWVNAICGPDSTSPSTATGAEPSRIVDSALLAQNLTLSEFSTELTRKEIERMRERWREGSPADAERWIQEQMAQPYLWQALPGEVQADMLQLLASIKAFAHGDLDQASRLFEQAMQIPEARERATIRAVLLRHTNDADTALAYLDSQDDDVDSLNLRAAILLEESRLTECDEVLELISKSFDPDAETYRLRALHSLILGKIADAVLNIDRAFEISPRWKAVKFARGVVYYMSSVSAVARPKYLVAWPEPIDWPLVKQDSDAISRFRDAYATFDNLSTSPSLSPTERANLRTWQMACLANDLEHQTEAAELCEAALSDDEGDFRAIAWAIARRWNVALQKSQAALYDRSERGDAPVPELVGLVNISLYTGQADAAIAVLSRNQNAFELANERGVWAALRSHAASLSGDRAILEIDANRAPDLIAGVADCSAVLIAAATLARERGDWRILESALSRCLEVTGDDIYRWDLCELYASHDCWEQIDPHTGWLIDHVQTAEAIRLAAFTKFHLRRYQDCLSLLSNSVAEFRGHMLPNDLRRLRIECQKQVGSVLAATANAQQIADETNRIEDLVFLLDVQARYGDVLGARLTARRLADHPDLDEMQALYVARQLVHDDPTLATKLWRQAVGQTLPDELILLAFDTGTRLGLDHETGELVKRMSLLAESGQGGIHRIDLDELVTMARHWHERASLAMEKYSKAEIPIHLVADVLNQPLARLYYEPPGRQSSITPLLLYIRYGALTDASAALLSDRGLRADVTGLLLAHSVGLLSTVERVFGPIEISPSLIPAIQQMRDEAPVVQPSRINATRLIRELIREEEIAIIPGQAIGDAVQHSRDDNASGEWSHGLDDHINRGGLVLDFSRVEAPADERATDSDRRHWIVNCRSIIEVMHTRGSMSQLDYEAALARLGNEGKQPPSTTLPELGDQILCQPDALELLAEAATLEPIASHFKLEITSGDSLQLDAEYSDALHREQVFEQLSGLLDHVQTGLRNGRYRIFSLRQATDSQLEDVTDLSIRSLLEQGLSADTSEVVAWIDDRHVSRFPSYDQAPIVGIYDVAMWLHSAGNITEAELFTYLQRLRSLSAKYVPVSVREILFHLRQASIVEGTLNESLELAVLRRYVASCFEAQNQYVQPTNPDAESMNPGEMPFIVSLHRVVDQALVHLWQTELNALDCHAEASWLLESMYLDGAAMRRSLGLDSESSTSFDTPLIGLSYSSLVVQGMSISGTFEDGTDRREAFLSWVVNALIQPRSTALPDLVPSITANLKQALSEIMAEETGIDSIPAPVLGAAIYHYLETIPSQLREPIFGDEEFMLCLGMTKEMLVKVGDFPIREHDYWSAATAAINGEPRRVRIYDSESELSFDPFTSEHGIPLFQVVTADGHPLGVCRVSYGFLHSSLSVRERTLEVISGELDCSRSELNSLRSTLLLATEPKKRAETAQEMVDSSGSALLRSLKEKIREGSRFYPADLFPADIGELLRHYRFGDPQGPMGFNATVSRIGKELTETTDPIVAIRRMCGLPISLDHVFEELLGTLTVSERREILRSLSISALSPLEVAHTARVLRLFERDNPAYGRLAVLHIRKLVNALGELRAGSFLALLNWIDHLTCPRSLVQSL